MRFYGVVCIAIGIAALIFRDRVVRLLPKMIPGEKKGTTLWWRVIGPAVLLVVVGTAMAFGNG